MPDATESVTTLEADVQAKPVMPPLNYRALWYIPVLAFGLIVNKLLGA